MPYLLNLIYVLLAAAASPWLLYSALFKGKYRQGWLQKLWGNAPLRTGAAPCAWVHAVSVGEVNLLGVLLGRLQSRFPEMEIVISTTTQTGYELAIMIYASHEVFFCPLDFSWAVKNAMRRIRPDLLILAELELWPNLLSAAKADGCPVVVMNGRLSENSHRGYQRLQRFSESMFSKLDLVGAQNEEYAERFEQLGAPWVEVTGSLKFDGAQTDRQNPQTEKLRRLAGFGPSDVVLLAGSTQRGEEAMAIEVFERLSNTFPQLRLAMAPRHPDRFDEVAELLQRSGIPWRRRSEISEAAGSNSGDKVLLIDTVGELGAWWGTAAVAYVGGSMGSRGGQNMIEPAAYGAAVSFGPNTRNFRDIVALMQQHDAAVVVRNTDDFHQFVKQCLEQKHYAASLGARAKVMVQSQLGAADRTLELIAKVCSASQENARRAA